MGSVMTKSFCGKSENYEKSNISSSSSSSKQQDEFFF
jgi:hypothetical protein